MGFGEGFAPELERIGKMIVEAAYRVHRALGPGLLESVYKKALVYELRKMGLRVDAEVPVPIIYDGRDLGEPLRIDLLVERLVVVEVKATEADNDIHKAQTLTYLRLPNLRLGFLINFNVVLVKDGIHRIINPHYSP